MTKISNQVVYIPDTEINGLDYLIGTDYDNAKKTVNFRVEDLGSHFNMVNGVRNFDYIFYQHQGVNPTPTDGYFYSNGNTQVPEDIEYFIFPKKTYRGKDSSQFFLSIATENPFDLIIAQKIDNNTVFFFRIDSIETFTNYFKLNVSEVFFPDGKALDYVLSYAVFNLKNESVGPIPTKTSDLTNDGEDGINPFITLQDLPIDPTKTSDLTNDGSDGTSTYVETDELGQVAFSNDYNDLDNLPTLPVVSTLLREEFVFSGSQTFTLTNNYAQVYSVEVQGQGNLSTSQYTLVAPNQITINDTLDTGDYIVILYSEEIAGVAPYYTQSQTDSAFIATIPKFIYVRNINDFPNAVSGVRTLLPDTTYFIADTIDLNGDRLVGSSNTTILGASSENSILTSTGLGVGVPLLSSIYTTPIRHIAINDVDTAFSFDGATNPNEMALDWTGVNFVNVPNVGIVKDASNFIFDKSAFLGSKNLKFDGTIDTIGIGNSLLRGDGLLGDIIKVEPTCTITRRFRIIYSPIVSFGLTKGINIDVNVTMPIESFILDTANFSGRAINSPEYLPGINYQDQRALFVNNVGIINTTAIANMYMKNNSVPTIVSVIGDRYAMSGTTQSNGVNQKFTHILANNSMRYDSPITRLFRVLITFTVESGNNNILGIYIGVKRGVSIDPTADRISESEVYLTTSGTRPDVGAVQALVELNQNDEVYMIVQNTTATTNITIEFMNTIIETTN